MDQPDKEKFVTILPVLDQNAIYLATRPEQGQADCVKCSINGGETLNFSTRSTNAHIRHHIKSGDEHANFAIHANLTPES
jgi:hypothetical protein